MRRAAASAIPSGKFCVTTFSKKLLENPKKLRQASVAYDKDEITLPRCNDIGRVVLRVERLRR
jgi:hypothetical protein